MRGRLCSSKRHWYIHGYPWNVLASCMVGTEAQDGEGHTDTAQGFLLCSCFSELQKASEQLDPKHLTTLQQNKTNHAGSQLGLPVNHSNCRFIGSDGLGSFAWAGKSFAFYLLVFLASGFLPWFLPSLWFHTITSRPWHWKTEEIEEERVEQHISQGCCCWHWGSPAFTGSSGALLHTSG